jgi:hypothetical protein
MKPERLLRAILPDVLIDNFDIVNFDKSADRFDIYLDEKKVQLKEDKNMNFCVEPGSFKVMVGASSADIRLEGSFEII